MARNASIAAPMASSPRHGLGRDHPRLGIESDTVERADDVVEVACGHLVPPAALHPEPGEQRDEGRIAEFGRAVDLAAPRAHTVEIEAKLRRERRQRTGLEPPEAGETGDEELRLALVGTLVFLDKPAHPAAAGKGAPLRLGQCEQRPCLAALADRRAPADRVAVE